MHPIPPDLDLSAYVGSELGSLILGPYAITFDFFSASGISPGATTGVLRIVAQGPWELHDPKGAMVLDSKGYAQRTPCALHTLLSSRVESVMIAAPDKIALSFETGHRLSLFTEIGGFENLSITIPKTPGGAFPEYIF